MCGMLTWFQIEAVWALVTSIVTFVELKRSSHEYLTLNLYYISNLNISRIDHTFIRFSIGISCRCASDNHTIGRTQQTYPRVNNLTPK